MRKKIKSVFLWDEIVSSLAGFLLEILVIFFGGSFLLSSVSNKCDAALKVVHETARIRSFPTRRIEIGPLL
jgi:hypothetical protein